MINLSLQTLHEFLPAHGKTVQIFTAHSTFGCGSVKLKTYTVEFAYEMRDAWDDSICTSWVNYENTEWSNSLPLDTPLIWNEEAKRYEVMTAEEIHRRKHLPLEQEDQQFYHKKIWYFTGGSSNDQITSDDQENEIVGIIDTRVLDAQLVASYEDGQHRKLHKPNK